MIKNNLKRERERRGLTQAAVASKIGIPQGLYSQFETGRSLPDGENELLALSSTLGVEPEALYPDMVLSALFGKPIRPGTAEHKPRPFFSVKLPTALAPMIDAEVEKGGYTTRTEYVVDMVRRALTTKE